MELTAFALRRWGHLKILRVMKLTALILLLGCLQVSATGKAQGIYLSEKNASLETVLKKIKKQTGYGYMVEDKLLQMAKPVTVSVQNVPLKEALSTIFKEQPLTYHIIGRTITIEEKVQITATELNIDFGDVKGRVVNENGEPLEGVTVTVKGTKNATATNANGEFILKDVEDNAILVFTATNIEAYQVKLVGRNDVTVHVRNKVSKLDEIKIIGYGTTTQRYSTGNVSKVTAEDISRQPVANPIAALQGRVPGLTVVQNSGLPGAAFEVQIRGRNSIAASNDPLFIVDGIPFDNSTLDMINPAGGITALSPFNSLNPSSIESIEILKDADATAIYGSRGANGVILITTKKGKAGKTKLDVNVYSGAGKVTRTMQWLNTEQYLQMRKEAFANDNQTPTVLNAPDLTVWSPSNSTDWQKLLIGGTAHVTDGNVNLSGGNEQTQFLIGANYRKETTVFPGDLFDNRIGFRFNLTHSSANKKFSISFNGNYSNDDNHLIRLDPNFLLIIPPNSPLPYDSLGNINWSEGGVSFDNPLGKLLRTYNAVTDYLQGSMLLKYQLSKSIDLKLSGGYSTTTLNSKSINPKNAFDPSTNPTSSSQFVANATKNWIVEPQLDYHFQFGKSRINALVGGSWQERLNSGTRIDASDYSSEALLQSTSGAGKIATQSRYSQYRYAASFARINYSYAERYILNLNGRYDGSSRFAPEKRFSPFGSIGAAWIFSQAKVIKEFSFLNYGKLRISYGVTGNDQIGDYQYLETWRSTANPYQGIGGLIPSGIANPEYVWEENKKLEAGIELGFWDNRVILIADYFRNRSGNQLLAYTLPAQAGRPSFTRNLPALVQNTGFEFELTTVNLQSKAIKWETSANLTIPRNKLLAYPGLESSNDASRFVIGQPLDIRKLFNYVGVDPQTGIYQFTGTSVPKDQTVIKTITPKYYGGIQNDIRFKKFDLYFLVQFVKQNGYDYMASITNRPGSMYNQPIYVLDRWQKPGDIAPVQKYSLSSVANTAYSNYTRYSPDIVTDASFIRLKNLGVSYNFSGIPRSKIAVQNVKIYIQTQNLLTITKYRGPDPENQNGGLPPLKWITAGVQLTL